MEEDSGILKFVRGVDLSSYRCDELIFSRLKKLENLKWIKLNSIDIKNIPDISSLKLLEYVSFKNNQISTIKLKEVLHHVSTLIFSRNHIKDDDINNDIEYDLDTTTLDLSHNCLQSIPGFLTSMSELIMLNISHNKISNIDLTIYKSLIYLDISNNNICEIDLSNCKMLQNLNISYTKINANMLNMLWKLENINTLNLESLNIYTENLNGINNLINLVDLNLSYNNIHQIPNDIYSLNKLNRLNLSNNHIMQISHDIKNLTNLKLLNISFNMISSLPDSIGYLTQLKTLYANGNQLTGYGLPDTLSKLTQLETIMLAFNQLEFIPPSLFHISDLKRVVLKHNKLLTLPLNVLDLKKLTLLDVKSNPNFVMPKKTVILQDAYSKMDFSYENVRNMVYTLIKQQLPPQDVTKGDITKQKMVVHKKTTITKKEEIESAEANKVSRMKHQSSIGEEIAETSFEIKKKQQSQFKAHMLDCNDIYPENISQIEGVLMFVIDKFSPILMEDHLQFFRGDCYIILHNYCSDNIIKHRIYFWIGSKSTIDKRSCAAMHAVNLKNFIGYDGNTIREEEGDESKQFLQLFPFGLDIHDGEHVPSALYDTSSLDKFKYIHSMYRIYTFNQSVKIQLQKVQVISKSLDERYVFLLLDRHIIYIYFGSKSKIVLRNKSTLFAEKLNQHSRKNTSKIITIQQNSPSYNNDQFWNILGITCNQYIPKNENSSYNNTFIRNPILYKTHLGSGYLELPQVEYGTEFNKSHLLSDSVYIIDFYDDIYVWYGKNTTKIIREAARRLAIQLDKFFIRPCVCQINLIHQNQEDFIFLSRFFGWNDSIITNQLSSTKSSTSTHDKPKITKVQKKQLLTHEDFNLPKLDIANIFMSRPQPLSLEHSQLFLDAVDEYLHKLDCFVYDNKNFVKMPEIERGQFYSAECYVFLCKNVQPIQNDNSINSATDGDDIECTFETKYKVFFWEGRDCPRTGFLTFAFSLQKQFEQLFGDKLSIERIQQQQEPFEFLALFHPTFILHRGLRFSTNNIQIDPSILTIPRFYQIRSTSGILTLRCIEIDCDAKLLSSKLHHVLVIPNNNIIYFWVGSKIDPTETNPVDFIIQSLKLFLSYTVITINEGEEDDLFWNTLGGKQEYDNDGLFIDYCRLFRCTNETGFYSTREKFLDFCQTDLADDDVMMLDTGSEVFLWEGTKASDAEKYFTNKIALIYVQHCFNLSCGKPRKIITIKPGFEPVQFKRVFHGFVQHNSTSNSLTDYN